MVGWGGDCCCRYSGASRLAMSPPGLTGTSVGAGGFRSVLYVPGGWVRLAQRLREALIAFTVFAVLSTALAIILKFTSEAA